MLMIGALWQVLGLSDEGLVKAVEKRFASKPTLLALDIALIRHGYELHDAQVQNAKCKMQNDGLVKKSDTFPPEKGGEGEE